MNCLKKVSVWRHNKSLQPTRASLATLERNESFQFARAAEFSRYAAMLKTIVLLMISLNFVSIISAEEKVFKDYQSAYQFIASQYSDLSSKSDSDVVVNLAANSNLKRYSLSDQSAGEFFIIEPHFDGTRIENGEVGSTEGFVFNKSSSGFKYLGSIGPHMSYEVSNVSDEKKGHYLFIKSYQRDYCHDGTCAHFNEYECTESGLKKTAGYKLSKSGVRSDD